MRIGLFITILAAASCAAGGEKADIQTDPLTDQPPEGAEDLADVPENPEPQSCTGNEDCNDDIACTLDLCNVDGTCRHVPDDGLCAEGERCSTTTGCGTGGCEGDDDCDNNVFCDGDERCFEDRCWPGTARTCDDGNPCTNDSCNMAADRCVHEWVPSCTSDAETDGDVPDPFDPLVHYSGTFTLYPVISASCVSCSYTIESVQFTRTDTTLTVQAAGFPLRQEPPPDGPTFLVVHSAGGGTYQLQATFYNADEFGGRWNASFSGGCSMCSPQALDVYGIRR